MKSERASSSHSRGGCEGPTTQALRTDRQLSKVVDTLGSGAKEHTNSPLPPQRENYLISAGGVLDLGGIRSLRIRALIQ